MWLFSVYLLLNCSEVEITFHGWGKKRNHFSLSAHTHRHTPTHILMYHIFKKALLVKISIVK